MGRLDCADLAEGNWQWLSSDPGSKGENWHDSGCLVLAEKADSDNGYYLLLRRSCAHSRQWQVCPLWVSPASGVPTLVGVAGSRWRIESVFEVAKWEVGLNE